jgi:hypothetical protein
LIASKNFRFKLFYRRSVKDCTNRNRFWKELVAKASCVVPGDNWQIHYILFARAGFTDNTRDTAAGLEIQLVDLPTFDAGFAN